MYVSDFISLCWLCIFCLALGLAGLFGQAFFMGILPIFIGGAGGISYAFYERWRGK